jgi:hypothetical protein
LSDREAEPPQDPDERSIDRWIAPFFHDSTLYPMVIVAAAIGVTLGSTLVLLAAADRNPFAAAALLLLLGMSADAVYHDFRRGRLGLASRAIAVLWALSVLGAGAVAWWGIF